MDKIGFIAPYRKAGERAMEIAHNMGIELIWKTAMLSEAIEVTRNFMEDQGISAVISRVATSRILVKEFGSGIVEIGLSDFSFLRAPADARAYSHKTAFVGIDGTEDGLDIAFAEHILGIKVVFIEYHGRDYVLARMRELGIPVMVTTFSYFQPTPESWATDIHVILIQIEDESLNQAIKTAVALSRSKEEAKKLSLYLNSEANGILALDGSGTIYVFNRAMEEITGILSNQVLGLTLESVAAIHPVFQYILDGQTIFNLDDTRFLAASFQYNTADDTAGRAIKLIQIENHQKRDSTVHLTMSQGGFCASHKLSNIIGDSPTIRSAKLIAARYAQTLSNVLITGESGTGKELFAQGIHNASPYRDGPFVAINCAALPETLLESELYGYEEGAFTGARRGGKIGLFELSHRGTLFLDEIGELPLTAQVRLLRSIQERQIIRLGGSRPIHITNRIICATNRDLKSAVDAGVFRADLFYRINILRINIPPLRERKSDIVQLARHLSTKFRNARNEPCYIPSHLLDRLAHYDWPGNVRQLEGFLESLIVTTDRPCVDEAHFNQMLQLQIFTDTLPSNLACENKQEFLSVQIGTLEDMTQQLVRQVFDLERENASRSAERLGISRSTLWRKLQTFSGSESS